MEQRRTNELITTYFRDMKTALCNRIQTLNLATDPNVASVVQFVCDYPPLVLGDADAPKRRATTCKSSSERCVALRAAGEQCSRRRREGELFCGTHAKGAPHVFEPHGEDVPLVVWVREIQGIPHYIDNMGNVYCTEDVINGVTHPRIVNHAICVDDVWTSRS